MDADHEALQQSLDKILEAVGRLHLKLADVDLKVRHLDERVSNLRTELTDLLSQE